MKVTPATQTLSADQLLAKATIAMPDASLRKYLPPVAADASAQIVVMREGQELTLFMDPANGAPARHHGQQVEPAGGGARSPCGADAWHHGRSPDRAGRRLGNRALVSGLYLWWPRKGVGGILGENAPARAVSGGVICTPWSASGARVSCCCCY